MPCMCWYTPTKEEQKKFKQLCSSVVEFIKEAQKIGDPEGITLDSAKTLIEHLYSGQCNESNQGRICK